MTQNQAVFMSYSLMAGWFIIMLFVQAGQLNCESLGGYINIDCGLAKGQSYIDDTTRVNYVSDDQFVETGNIYNISETYTQNYSTNKQYFSLRSFPNGSRNCYLVNSTVQSVRYLVRVGFLYGNYDGRNNVGSSSPILFDLHIGVNFWDTVNITDALGQYQYELITVASNNFISICLVNTGSGIPFISLIEMRPLNSTMYMAANSSQSLKLRERSYLTNRQETIRLPQDVYDRIWKPWNVELWKNWYFSDANVKTSSFEVPPYILQFAASNKTTTKGSIYFKREYPQIDNRYLFLHFAGVKGNRKFNVTVNNILLAGPLSLPTHQSTTVYTPEPSQTLAFEVLLEATSDSSSEPLLTAVEVYSVLTETELATNEDDFNAIMKIKQTYSVKKNWSGDPCSPKNYTWDGVGCQYTAGASIIISLNLSSSSLHGSVSDSFYSLKSILILDLSNNQLNGDVPDSLAKMPSLQVLNLAGNCLKKVPELLKEKSKKGTLQLRFDAQTKCEANLKKKILVITIVVVPSIIAMVMLVGLIMYIRKGNLSVGLPSNSQELVPFHIATHQFVQKELKYVTNNFKKEIGQGGFGTVYYGKLDDGTEVAVKLRHESSSQGVREFLSEAHHLSRIHHKYLVKMIGYCNDSDSVALVFEYMSQGNLEEHLRGEVSHSKPLSWSRRLQIALESALGLEYLHKGCSPIIIHRDVKTNNILLNDDLQAKIADFGISKAFSDDYKTHETTRIAGTLGYLDPAYYGTGMLTEKSDVYSFGIVLLEIITGQRPLVSINDEQRVHISKWVQEVLCEGNNISTTYLATQGDVKEKISAVADKTMLGNYNVKSVQKAIGLALQCVGQEAASRPTMTEVVLNLKKCIKLEFAGSKPQSSMISHDNHDSMEVPLASEQIL